MTARPSSDEEARRQVPVTIVGPPSASILVVLAPGAGAPMDSDFMEFMAAGFVERGLRVARFNFLYQHEGRKAPDRQPVLEETFRGVLSSLTAEARDRLVVLGGKSMGGRIASHIVASGTGADGLLFFGYPLHPPGRPERIRDSHLYDIEVPMLFVEGTRDPFCPLETLEEVRPRLRSPNEVFVIEDGDHSLKVRKSSGRSTVDAWNEALQNAARWMERLKAQG